MWQLIHQGFFSRRGCITTSKVMRILGKICKGKIVFYLNTVRRSPEERESKPPERRPQSFRSAGCDRSCLQILSVEIANFGDLIFWSFLGTFSTLRKATVSFIISVRPSVRPSVRLSAWNSSVSSWPILMKFDVLETFRSSFQKIQVPLISNKNNAYFTRRPFYICDIVSPNYS